jgi:hypothetical protein
MRGLARGLLRATRLLVAQCLEQCLSGGMRSSALRASRSTWIVLSAGSCPPRTYSPTSGATRTRIVAISASSAPPGRAAFMPPRLQGTRLPAVGFLATSIQCLASIRKTHRCKTRPTR